VRVALLSPYDGGSHAAWGRGLARHSSADIEVLGLPARFWKWRMHGAALTLARRFEAIEPVDLLLATDMLDLTSFLALTRRATAHLPAALYMHENQLTYPLPVDPRQGAMRRQAGERDRHYGFINLVSMLAADRVLFNSAYHRDAFLSAAPGLLGHYPDHHELQTIEQIESRSEVLPVGVELSDIEPAVARPEDAAPLIVWNQRWEYDKNPEEFFAALLRLAEAGQRFTVALCGQRFARQPGVFESGIDALGDRVEHVGWLERAAYVELLGRAQVVLSTAHHEFFGISVVEAIAAGAWPVLPRRLSYPQILPEAFHARCLYEDREQLDRLLLDALREPASVADRRELGGTMRRRYDWPAMAPRYDRLFEQLAAETA
jgi:glycosyltransferase involved in cell wall biosynthesis